MGKDVDGKNSSKRFKAKKSWLIRKGMSEEEAHKKARAYAGGKTSPKAGQTEEPIVEEFSAYTNLVELPEEVRGLLPVEAQEIWMRWFNAFIEGRDRVKCEEAAWTAVEGAGYTVKASEKMGNKFYGLIALGEAMLMPAPSGMQYSSTSVVEIMRTGQWEHPLYGPISIMESDLDGFIANFFANVRGIDIAVDQEHKPEAGAMGWFKKLWKIPRDDEGFSLQAEIQWTYQGEQLIRDGIYRYFSPEFTNEWKDPESGRIYKNVLFGGALTNRPFIKNMDPILLSEGVMETLGFILKETQPGGNRDKNKGGTPDVKLLAEHYKALGLSENATEAEVLAAIVAMKNNPAPGKQDNTEVVQLSETVKVMGEQLTTAQAEIKKLSETNILLAEAAKAVKWESISQKAFSEGRMTVALSEKFKPLFMANPEGIGAIIEDLPKIIPGEKGHSNAGGAAGSTSKMSEAQAQVAGMLGLSEEQILKATPEWLKEQGGKE